MLTLTPSPDCHCRLEDHLYGESWVSLCEETIVEGSFTKDSLDYKDFQKFRDGNVDGKWIFFF